MDRQYISTLVYSLSDISLALLLCLTSSSHCLITTTDLDELTSSLSHASSTVFSLTVATIECASPELTLSTFIKSALIRGSLANVLILRNLDVAPDVVQVQVLEVRSSSIPVPPFKANCSGSS